MMYNDLASVYDKLMEDMPYKEWADFILKIFEKENKRVKNLLDLGSGTGSISSLLSKAGIMVTNLDFSEEMLEKARVKYAEAGISGEFVNKDIRDLDFTNLYDCAISTFDTLNYFLEENEMEDIFKRVYKSLKDEGLFIFDMNTLHKFQVILGREVYTYNTEELVYIWENDFNNNTEILEIDLSFFLKMEEGKYSRFNEYHVQKYYSINDTVKLLEKAGFKEIKVYQDLMFKEPEEKGVRNFFVALKS